MLLLGQREEMDPNDPVRWERLDECDLRIGGENVNGIVDRTGVGLAQNFSRRCPNCPLIKLVGHAISSNANERPPIIELVAKRRTDTYTPRLRNDSAVSLREDVRDDAHQLVVLCRAIELLPPLALK